VVACAAAAGCSSSSGGLGLPGDDGTGGGPGGGAGSGSGGDGSGPSGPGGACVAGRSYTSFAGTELTAARTKAAAGMDRRRAKPYDALTSEYARVLGATPASLADDGATFGVPQKRWYVEPQASAVSLYTAYADGFDGCLGWVATQPSMSAAPAAASAQTACASMTRAFWSRDATPDELAACTDLAVSGVPNETDVHRRWAYACAAVLTASGFLTY